MLSFEWAVNDRQGLSTICERGLPRGLGLAASTEAEVTVHGFCLWQMLLAVAVKGQGRGLDRTERGSFLFEFEFKY